MDLKKNNSGFTIIELMIAVAIIGVLAAIAMPAYNKYLRKTKVTEAFTMLRPYQISVIECAQDIGSLTDCSSGKHGILGQQNGTFGSIINVESYGVVTYKFTESQDNLKDGIVTLKPRFDAVNMQYRWDCYVDNSIITIDITPQPQNCQPITP